MEWTIRLEARTGWGQMTSCGNGLLCHGRRDITVPGLSPTIVEPGHCSLNCGGNAWATSLCQPPRRPDAGSCLGTQP